MPNIYINWTNVTELSELPGLANTATAGGFWSGMLYMIWIILLLLMIVWGFETAIIVSSFISLIIGIILVYAGLVSFTAIMPLLAIIIIMFLYVTYIKNKT